MPRVETDHLSLLKSDIARKARNGTVKWGNMVRLTCAITTPSLSGDRFNYVSFVNLGLQAAIGQAIPLEITYGYLPTFFKVIYLACLVWGSSHVAVILTQRADVIK